MRKFLLTATMFFVGMVATFAQVPDASGWKKGDEITTQIGWTNLSFESTTNLTTIKETANDAPDTGTPDVYEIDGWTFEKKEKKGNTTRTGGLFELYDGAEGDLYQYVLLPAGMYKVECQGYYRNGTSWADDPNTFNTDDWEDNAQLYAQNGVYNIESKEFTANKTFECPLMPRLFPAQMEQLFVNGEGQADWMADGKYDQCGGCYGPCSVEGSLVWFNAGLYQPYDDEEDVQYNTVTFFLKEDGYVRIGVKKEAVKSADSFMVTNFKMYYMGAVADDVELQAIKTEIGKVLKQMETLANTYEGGMMYSLINDASMDFDEYESYTTLDECNAALTAVTEVYNKALEASAAYKQIVALLPAMQHLYNTTDYAGKAAFGEKLTAAENCIDVNYEVTEDDSFEKVCETYEGLLAARLTYLMTQEKVNGAYNFSVVIDKPFFCQNQYTPVWNEAANAFQFPKIDGVEDDLQPENTWATIQEQGYDEAKAAEGRESWIPISDGVAPLSEKAVENQWCIKSTTWHGGGPAAVTMQHSYPAIGGWRENPTGDNPELVYQTITGLPDGYYGMSALMCNAGADPSPLQFVYIETTDGTQEKALLTQKGNPWWGGNKEAWRSGVWEQLTPNMVLVKDGKVTIGASSDGFYATTGFQLYYYGETPDFTTLIAPTLNDVKTAAEGLSWAGDKTAVQAILNQIPAEITTPEAYQAALASIAEANNYITTATATINAWKGIENFSELLDKYEESSPEYAIVDYAFMETFDLGNGANDTYLDAIQNNKDYDAYVSYLGYRASMGALINDPAVAAVVSTQNTYLATNFAHDTELDEFKAALAVPYNKALLASLDAEHASEAKPVDLTALIVNPDFSEGTMGWNGEMTIDTIYCTPERYDCDFDINQTIHALPVGCYQIQVQAFYRDGGDAQTAYDNWFSAAWDVEFWDNPNVLLYANQVGEVVTSLASEEFEDQSMTQYYTEWQKAEEGDAHGDDVYEPKWIYQSDAEAGKENSYPWDAKIDDWGSIYYYPQSQYGASMRLNSDPSVYVNKVTFMVEEEGSSVTFGIKNIAYIKNHWCVFDNFKLFYLGTETPTNVEGLNADATAVAEYFSANGVKQNGLQKGFNIVKKNGNVSKIYVK